MLDRAIEPLGQNLWEVEMLVDCDSCAVRDIQCGDCVMSVLLASGSDPVELDVAETAAIGALANGGLLPPLRLVPVPAARDGVPRVTERCHDVRSAIA